MSKYQAEVKIMPKDGVLDTQGKAVEKTLKANGYQTIADVRVGRLVHLNLETADENEAKAKVKEMADDLLANELIESYEIIIRPLA